MKGGLRIICEVRTGQMFLSIDYHKDVMFDED
jgi:hypothetical protein